MVASISCAEAGAEVDLVEAHQQLGGRARVTTGDYVAHDGPHVLYSDGPWWGWLRERDLLGDVRKVPLSGLGGLLLPLRRPAAPQAAARGAPPAGQPG